MSPLPEQRAIAATLGALDDKIELNRKMNATLEAMARALFRDWFVDFGPTRATMEGRAPYLSPDLWSLFPDGLNAEGNPEGWSYEQLLNQADWVNGAAYKNMHFSDAPDALPVIKIAELKNGVTGNTQRTATDLGARYLIDDGELLFSWSGNPDTSIDTFLWTGGVAEPAHLRRAPERQALQALPAHPVGVSVLPAGMTGSTEPGSRSRTSAPTADRPCRCSCSTTIPC